MPRAIVYLGPAGAYDTAGRFDKRYVFYAPDATREVDGVTPLAPEKRGASVQVNNDHIAELLTTGGHRFVDTAGATDDELLSLPSDAVEPAGATSSPRSRRTDDASAAQPPASPAPQEA